MATQTDKLSQLLSENAITPEDFAYCIGIDVNVAEDLCAGNKKVTKSLAKQIEQTFSKPANWLIDESDANSEGPNYDLFG